LKQIIAKYYYRLFFFRYASQILQLNKTSRDIYSEVSFKNHKVNQ